MRLTDDGQQNIVALFVGLGMVGLLWCDCFIRESIVHQVSEVYSYRSCTCFETDMVVPTLISA